MKAFVSTIDTDPKEMKGLGKTNEVGVFSLLRKQITEFEPLKLLAIQDQMLNNDNITNMTDEQYYTIEEVAKMLKVAYLTVYRWIQSGKLVAFKAGKQYRVKNKDLDIFVKSYKTIKEI